jgi:type II secretory pathway pseudopilin PulG
MQLIRIKHQQGISLITSLVVIALVAAVILIMTGRTLSELQHSKDNSAVVQTLLLARGGARLGQDYLYSDHLKDLLKNSLTKLTKGSTNRWFFGGNTWEKPAEKDVAKGIFGLNRLADDFQTLLDGDFCSQNIFVDSTTSIRVRIYVTRSSCGIALPSKIDLPLARLVDGAPRGLNPNSNVPMQEQRQTYALPFVMVAEGVQAGYTRSIAVQGEIRFTAGKSTFSRYAYFTNQDKEANLWFSTSTLIDGPIHTNTNFMFTGNPWFGSTVSSAGCEQAATGQCNTKAPGAVFTNASNFLTPSEMSDPQNPSDGTTTPTIVGGVDWNANYVELPENNSSQRNAARGRNDTDTADISTEGLLFTTDLESLTLWVVDGSDPEVSLTPNGFEVDGTPKWTPTDSVYQRIRGCPDGVDETLNPEQCLDYRIAEDDVIQYWDKSEVPYVWRTVTGAKPFNGVIYVDGEIERLKGPGRSPANSVDGEDAGPAIATFSEITIASDEDIRITGDLKYEQPPHTGAPKRNNDGTVTPPGSINPGATNVLGIYTSGGDILVGNQNSDTTLNAPNNVMVHASLMAATSDLPLEGQIRVEDYNNGPCRGKFQLIGGMIQTTRGPFNTFTGTTCISGYERTYTYDQRFLFGVAPPFFPTSGESDPDNIFVITYGQLEQVF